jgi:hypothetical protein
VAAFYPTLKGKTQRAQTTWNHKMAESKSWKHKVAEKNFCAFLAYSSKSLRNQAILFISEDRVVGPLSFIQTL